MPATIDDVCAATQLALISSNILLPIFFLGSLLLGGFNANPVSRFSAFTNPFSADTIDTAIDDITNLRATVGAGLSRLEQVVGSLETSSSNLSSARGRIMDADFAKETANLTRSQILQQAGTAMLAQANQLPNNVLSLLR